MSIGTLFNIGNSALNASQNNIAVTGNNIANVNTPGYNRQYVRLEDAYSIHNRPGASGQGVDAVEVMRRFNRFLEKSYLEKASTSARWTEQYNTMSSVENIFNEANRTGVSTSMVSFFKGWNDLGLRPNDAATRQSLLSYADSLTLLMRDSMANLQEVQRQMDLSIREEVTKTNDLINTIADLNKQIASNTVKGTNNPNDLLDRRDLAVRQLAESIDIDVQDNGGGDYTIRTKTGHTLVQGGEKYALDVRAGGVEANKIPGSTYAGNLSFSGTDTREYTIEMVQGGTVTDPPTMPQPSFRVSLDGGKSWLRNDDGSELNVPITGTTDPVTGDVKIDPIQVKNLSISFDDAANFNSKDRFIVTPKEGIYWIEPTRGPVNLTPQTYLDGTDNQNRLTGGKLAAYYNVRDENCGRYQDELDAVAKSLIWEVNRLHSQGAGLTHMTSALGTGSVYDITKALGTPQSGLLFNDKLTSGNIQFHLYDREEGTFLNGGPLDFDGGTGGIQNFDPAVHSMQDVRDAINRSYPGQLKASIVDNKLVVEADPAANPPVSFSMGTDTTGLMAALGINTFFQGNGASNIAVNPAIHADLNRIAAGAINGSNELNPGDNSVANSLGTLLTKPVTISTPWRTTGNQCISEYYSAMVSKVGADTRTAKTNADYNLALARDLDNKQAAISGVSIDEEMANLIKFQHSYTAAAKLITTADQMLQTLLGLKQ